MRRWSESYDSGLLLLLVLESAAAVLGAISAYASQGVEIESFRPSAERLSANFEVNRVTFYGILGSHMALLYAAVGLADDPCASLVIF